MFRRTKVQMVKSVGPLAAGRTFWLPRSAADQLIVKGYAEGKLSREYSDEERVALLGPTQTVAL